MAINAVQSQPSLSMAEFIERDGTEGKRYLALYRSRWPQGWRCPHCDGHVRSCFRSARRGAFQCRNHRPQTPLIGGPVFEASALPLTPWCLAMNPIASGKTNLSGLALNRKLSVCNDPARKLKHKAMQAMTEREECRQLAGIVQSDDVHLGDERHGDKPGRGFDNKQPFLIAVSTDEQRERLIFAAIEPVIRRR